MIRTLSVFYRHRPYGPGSTLLSTVEQGLADVFRDFCAETFNVDGPVDYPPMRLVAVESVGDLARKLFTSEGPRGVLTETGRTCCLLMVEDALVDSIIERLPLRDWLKLFFPAVPKVLMTTPGQAPVALVVHRWVRKEIEVFEHPDVHRERIVHLFKSFWMPRFSTALRQYVRVKAGTNCTRQATTEAGRSRILPSSGAFMMHSKIRYSARTCRFPWRRWGIFPVPRRIRHYPRRKS